MDYGVPGGNGDRTVVYATFLDNGNPKDLAKETAQYLLDNGITRVLVGHSPHGDSPSIIQDSEGIQVVMADSSYSNMKEPDNRGLAVNEILLHEVDQSLEVNGLLKDERAISFTLNPPSSSPSEPFIGKVLSNGYWVKSKLSSEPNDGKIYLACKGQGFNLDYQWLTALECQELLNP